MNTKKLLLTLVCSSLFLVHADDADFLTDASHEVPVEEVKSSNNLNELEVSGEEVEVQEADADLLEKAVKELSQQTLLQETCKKLNEQVATHLYDSMIEGEQLDALVNNLSQQEAANLPEVLDNLKRLALEGHHACIRSMDDHSDTERVYDLVKVLAVLEPQETYKQRIEDNKDIVGGSAAAALIIGLATRWVL